jgi:Subtilase family
LLSEGIITLARGWQVARTPSAGHGKAIRLLALAVLAVLAVALLPPATGPASSAPAERPVSVIVRAEPGALGEAARLVERLGGTVGRRIGIINGFAATVPAGRLPRLRGAAGVASVAPNEAVRLESFNGDFDPEKDYGSSYRTARVIDAEKAWDHKLTGRGVDVAVTDSGVVPVKGLDGAGKLVNAVDISPEAAHAEVAYLDGYGHGTHMASIIAGRDPEVVSRKEKDDKRNLVGVAPDARIVNVKVADGTGATDVSQVLAGIDWVVQHKQANGLNIRVLNLSFGTDGTQDYRLDPLAYAVEVAWHQGVFVVVSAGNRGFGSPKLNNPATSPWVLAVGASDHQGSDNVDNDTVAPFSSRGDASRRVDLVAPGKSVVGLRVPGSLLDSQHPGGRVGERYFRGSGTSQAAAVASGAAALLLQQRPDLTPDQLKALLVETAKRLKQATPEEQGAGILDVDEARHGADEDDDKLEEATQTWPRSTGTGSLEAARGSAHVLDDQGQPLTGEQDALGEAWDASNLTGRMWSGRMWSGRMWSGDGWSGRMWSGRMWSGRMWSGDGWSGRMWSGNVWSSAQWGGDQTVIP